MIDGKDVLCFIFLGACLMFLINMYTIKNDYATSVKYDGCWEQYTSNEMPSELFSSFMTDCMK